jgi:hypothetical protein
MHDEVTSCFSQFCERAKKYVQNTVMSLPKAISKCCFQDAFLQHCGIRRSWFGSLPIPRILITLLQYLILSYSVCNVQDSNPRTLDVPSDLDLAAMRLGPADGSSGRGAERLASAGR